MKLATGAKQKVFRAARSVLTSKRFVLSFLFILPSFNEQSNCVNIEREEDIVRTGAT